MEIQHRDKQKKDQEESEKILIVAHNRNICHQLRNYLTMGANKYLLYEALKKLSHKEIQETR